MLRSIETEQDRAALLKLLSKRELPFTVSAENVQNAYEAAAYSLAHANQKWPTP